ncbi:tyrosine-protein phosphatase non-receptor type 14 [Leptopilina heterotoma]|uniref:tyrosine-protein phosphatase non-receptor type 14 n=1 Tax=Leptopilina heterotoma TaxID=63436 RepID=UPI001CA9EFA5|nr:tyrosine-protein phosphatase non-receptor type 14 [Leptopilina heterotoma]
MPFKFYLKKSRQYDVVSKNQYVICIELLDTTSIECTLSIGSTGRECLINVTQRLGLGQPEFFGLCYICKDSPNTSRWINMDKPLKRQLEKKAKNFIVYLRVMHYIFDVQFIQDDFTRYHYYLQLKNDILEGKITYDARQASLLASYSMQAEFGNYDADRHSPECLQQDIFFPKVLIEAEPRAQETLLNDAICQFKSLTGVTQSAAEEMYIMTVMQMEGYGYETFVAKDEGNNEIILGISINGIMVGSSTSQSAKFYRWSEISNVISHKKTFRIEWQVEGETPKQFTFGESRLAKYAWQLCITKHTFAQRLNEQLNERVTNGNFNETNEQIASLRLDHQPENHMRWTSYSDLSTSPCPVVSVSSKDTSNLQALLPPYRPAPDYDTAMQMKYNNGAINSQPYYANQSTIIGADLSCLINNVANRNRY